MSAVEAAVLNAVADLTTSEAAALLRRMARELAPRRGARVSPNEALPCGTDSARRRHLAHGESCAACLAVARG